MGVSKVTDVADSAPSFCELCVVNNSPRDAQRMGYGTPLQGRPS
jgi:hypothetical protein